MPKVTFYIDLNEPNCGLYNQINNLFACTYPGSMLTTSSRRFKFQVDLPDEYFAPKDVEVRAGNVVPDLSTDLTLNEGE